ncbi:hypothetical protein F442_05216 [Phytophthora nicotianae P10297]|uniref:Uncharacterized protein n=1 Tax=Phytophthora nicotianae P10297 TaxID=1317064 RepID=W2ZPG8_PHYNI|nr:hypothetical protein F442_05216 [Phytophthora nicotianae P10297]
MEATDVLSSSVPTQRAVGLSLQTLPARWTHLEQRDCWPIELKRQWLSTTTSEYPSIPRARRQLARRKPITVTILVCAATKPRKFRRTDSVGLIFAHFETHVDVRVHPTTEIWKNRRQVLLRRSARETEALKQKLSGIQNTTSSLGRSLMEMVLLLREENEMKAEGRRVCEEQRRRDELEAREARYQAEKIEAEERRRQDKLEREDRTRRDREDARARMQELAMLIGALTKST